MLAIPEYCINWILSFFLASFLFTVSFTTARQYRTKALADPLHRIIGSDGRQGFTWADLVRSSLTHSAHRGRTWRRTYDAVFPARAEAAGGYYFREHARMHRSFRPSRCWPPVRPARGWQPGAIYLDGHASVARGWTDR